MSVRVFSAFLEVHSVRLQVCVINHLFSLFFYLFSPVIYRSWLGIPYALCSIVNFLLDFSYQHACS